MMRPETIDTNHIGISQEILSDPLIKDSLDSTTQFLERLQDNVRDNLEQANQDPALSALVFRQNNCKYSIRVCDQLVEDGIDAKCLINDVASEYVSGNSDFATYTKRVAHIVVSVKDSEGSEVIIDPFWSQFLEQYGMSFDLAAALGDQRVYPSEYVLAYRPQQIDYVAEWISNITRFFWDRVSRGSLRSSTDIFTLAKEEPSFFLRTMGVKYDPIKPLTNAEILKAATQIWDRDNYRELSQEEMSELDQSN